MIPIQLIDARTGENMTELGSREWPIVPVVGEELVFTNPVRRLKVVSVTWIDLAQHRGKLIVKVGLSEQPTEAA
jgi:hypothetical protein